MRTLLWPRRSFWRSAQYFGKRVLRLNATPHAVAAGVAAGVFASFLPFVGFHFLIAAGLAWALAGNVVASAIGTAVGNPVTFPLIWSVTLELGRFILYGYHPEGIVRPNIGDALRQMEFAQLWEPLIKPMSVGAIPLGLVFGVGFYIFTRWATAAFQKRRRKRIAERVRRRAAGIEAQAARG